MNSVEVLGPDRQNRAFRRGGVMVGTTTANGRRLPRALRPFRHPAYRRLAVALTLSTFASGVWLLALVWHVLRLDGVAAQPSVVPRAVAVGGVLPALLGG